jgi:DNA-binding response OmpR family regulator
MKEGESMAKILIVEDDQVLSDAYKLILKKHGHEIATAFNGAEGLKKASDFKPSIILLDLLMPEMDGIEFLNKYGLKSKHPDVFVVILSNIGDEKKVQLAMELGAYKYIVKAHAKPEELSLLVNHLVNKDLDKTT